MIYHIIDIETWKQVREGEFYAPSSIEQEGFIHCSTDEQVIHVANSFYKESKNLLLLGIKEELVQSEIIYEDLYELNQLYPHIYGVLNLNAVKVIYRLDANENGEFTSNYLEWDGN